MLKRETCGEMRISGLALKAPVLKRVVKCEFGFGPRHPSAKTRRMLKGVVKKRILGGAD